MRNRLSADEHSARCARGRRHGSRVSTERRPGAVWRNGSAAAYRDRRQAISRADAIRGQTHTLLLRSLSTTDGSDPAEEPAIVMGAASDLLAAAREDRSLRLRGIKPADQGFHAG